MTEEEIAVKYGQKFCVRCRTLKPLSDFGLDKRCRFGVPPWCKDCEAEHQSKHRQNTRKEVLDSMGGKYVYCGCDLFEALQINHKYGGGSQDPAGRGANLVRVIRLGRRKTDDLEVACYVCNAWHKLVKLDGLPDGWTITWRTPQ